MSTASLTASAKVPAMRLLRLEVQGYRALRSADIAFPDGLIGIVGPNGAGKTTVLEAVLFALGGTAASRTNKEDLLTEGGSDDLRVEFAFSLGAVSYRVLRTIRRRDLAVGAKLYRDGEQVADGAESVTSEIAALIGGLRELSISRFVAQKQLNALSTYQPSERKKLILRLLGVDEVEDAIKSLRAQLTDFDRTIKARRSILPNITEINAHIADLERELADLDVRLADQQRRVDTAAAALTGAEQTLAAAEAAAEAAAQHATTLELASASLAALDDDELRLAERAEALDEAGARLTSAESQVAAAEANREEFAALEQAAALRRALTELRAQAVALASALRSERAAVAELERRAASEAALAGREKQLAARIGRSTSTVATAEAERNEARAALSRVREDRRRLETQIAALDAGADAGACPTCDQSIADPAGFRRHLDQSLTALRRDEQAIIAKGTAAKTASERAAAEQASAEAELTALADQLADARRAAGEVRLARVALEGHEAEAAAVAEQIADAEGLAYDEERHASLAAEAAALPTLLGLVATLRGQLADRERLAADRERLAARRAELDAQRQAATAAAKQAGYDPAAHAAAKAGLEAAREQERSATLTLTASTGERRLVADRLDRARADAATHARLTGEIERISDDRRAVQIALDMMERFKVRLIGRIRPALARKASVLLRELTDGRYTELALDEEYEISLGSAGRTHPLARFSGGESDLANLCLRLAISELINESTGVGSTFIVLDEVLGSQDPDRQENIMTALPKLGSHFAQVLMIAHIPAVQDRFEHVIEVRYDPASATSTVIYAPPDPVLSAVA